MKLLLAKRILAQLGGNRFIVMTGAKHFLGDKLSLSFKIGGNCKRVNYVKIVYDESRDLYNMGFYYASVSKKSGPQKKEIAAYNGIFFDQLQELFTEATGMDTHL